MDKKDEEHTESTGQSQVTQNGEPIIGETEAESKAKEAEKQDMAALEVLLAKAQKAREIQTKMDEAVAKANQKKKISKKPLPVTTCTITHATLRLSGSAKMYLDSVLKKGTHSKTVSREQGHIPSRTGAGPSGKVTQRSTTPASVTREEKDNNTRTHSEQSCHDSQIALSSERDSAASDELFEKTNSVNKSTECSGEFQANKLQVDNAKQLALNDGVNKPLSVTGIPRQSSGLGNLDSQSKTEVRDLLQDCKKESLDPFAVDYLFVLPGKYRKLKSTSTWLYSELRKIIEKDGKPSPCQHFVERLEAGFDVGNISSRNEIQDKANGLLEEHEQLSTLTDAVVIRSCSLRDDAQWQEVYKCYRHWQIVLSKFNELQRRTQKLLEAQEQLTKCCPCGNCGAFDRDHPRDTSASVREGRKEGCVLLSRWLPDEIEHYSSVELCEGLNQQYGTVDFTYSSVKELRELVQLHHEVQLLCLQLHVKQLAGEKLLPLLEKLDPSDSAFVPLYRVTHGLLCGSGKVFPAMVLDNF
ncbi:hypothetical protein OS493_013242 [Desmophyllum pertusum]|uniref:Uncharacterized protein n=1 Tax=Desmophyllum pertusum TaxID=174260 RepID=A0A9X0CLI9_9CNID|nr:hypothetical protein OS493_013242 [Desmophyllum pertusum]